MNTKNIQKGEILPHIDILLKRAKTFREELPKYKDNVTSHIKGKPKNGSKEE